MLSEYSGISVTSFEKKATIQAEIKTIWNDKKELAREVRPLV